VNCVHTKPRGKNGKLRKLCDRCLREQRRQFFGIGSCKNCKTSRTLPEEEFCAWCITVCSEQSLAGLDENMPQPSAEPAMNKIVYLTADVAKLKQDRQYGGREHPDVPDKPTTPEVQRILDAQQERFRQLRAQRRAKWIEAYIARP